MIYLILFLGFIIRLVNLNQSLWLDEAISVLAAKNYSYAALITRFSPGDFHPPLYYLGLKFWDSFWGFSEIASRLPSVIFGVAACFMVYLIGKKLFNRQTGLWAAAFLAVNPLAVYYSQEARMYALAMLAVAMAVYFYLAGKRNLFILTLLIALYTDYLTWLMLPVFLLLAKDRKNFLKSFLLLFIFLLPWLPFLFRQLGAGWTLAGNNPAWREVVGGFSLKALPLTLVKFTVGRITLDNKVLYALVFGIPALFYLWLIKGAKERTLWFWLLIPLGLGYLLSLIVPVFSYFRFLFVLPAFLLLVAYGASRYSWAPGAVIAVSFASLVFFNLHPRFWREDWRGAVAYMESNGGRAVIPSLAQAAPLYYYRHNLQIEDKNNLTLNPTGNVYLLRYVQEIFDPQDRERLAIESAGFQKASERNFNGVVVWTYRL